jgi:hypothetical protein
MRALLLVLALLVAFAPAASAAHHSKCPATAKKKQKRCRGRNSHPHAPAAMTPGHLTAPIGDPLPPAPPPAPDPGPATTPAPATSSRIGVVAREWSLTLSRTTLPAGNAIVQLQNFGEDAHNLRIERVDGTGAPVDVPLAEAGEVKSARAGLSAGQYKLYCSLPGHESNGMHAALTVGG